MMELHIELIPCPVYHNSRKIIYAKTNEPNQCPACLHSIIPQFLHGCCFYQTNKETGTEDEIFGEAYVFFRCTNFACNIDITVCYNVVQESFEEFSLEQKKIFPAPSADNCLPKELFPRFHAIYSQSVSAESWGLNEISGMGFRKALEFLVRDFLNSSLFPSGKNLDDLTFANCINQLDDELKSLATGANWLGSDFVHYTRKHEEFDVSDLKEFINLLSHKIDLILRTEKYTKLSEQMRVKRNEK